MAGNLGVGGQTAIAAPEHAGSLDPALAHVEHAAPVSSKPVLDPSPGLGKLGKFTLLELIGEGGMARIFLARASGIGGFEKLVVVKQVLPRLAEDAEFVARFFQEARLTATLDHPNIAAVHEVDRDGDAYFYSMEYVRGCDLQKLGRRAKQRGRTLSLDEIITIVTSLCAGLHHAHTRPDETGRPLGIVHRDVTPSNVLLSFDGAVKLADFGVAKARTGMVSTVAGTLRGKIAYMSPEQCRGEALDRRSDVYSVGALLWELLTGQRLHQGESEIALLRQIADGLAPSPQVLRPDSAGALERIVARALTREPADRYPSAHALQTDLEDHAREHRLVIGARTVAALMQELFEGEATSPVAHGEAAPTVPFSREPASDADPKTPPTATLLPAVVSHASRASLAVPASASGSMPPRRAWSTLAIGLAAGAVLASGGLFLVERPDSARDGSDPAPSPSLAPRPESSPAVGGRANEPEPALHGGRSDVSAPVRAGATTQGSNGIATPIVAAEASPPAALAASPTAKDRDSSATTRTRRKPKPRVKIAAPKPIDLDSPLPPGAGAK